MAMQKLDAKHVGTVRYLPEDYVPTVDWENNAPKVGTKLYVAPQNVTRAPEGWRELCRRLYVELFHCDQQMRSTRNEDGEPHWTQGAAVRDVLRDAKNALDAAPAAPAVAPVPTPQQISDYLHGLDRIQRELVEREARLLPTAAPAQGPFDVALAALDRYQRNWDTGLPGEYAQPERIHMECAVEAVREALTEARDAAPAQAEQQGDDGETPRPMTDAILRRMLKDETRGDTVYRCGYNQAIENVRKILAMRSHLETGEQPSARVALSDDEMFEAFNQGYDGISDKGDLGSYKRAVLAGIKAILAASAAQGGKS